jgi:cysteine synthase
MTGLGLSFTPPNFDPSLLDVAYTVSDTIAFSYCHQIAKLEGLLLGASTGAILAGGLTYAHKNQDRPLSILMLNPDRGDRYLETIYNNQWLKDNEIELRSKEQLDLEIRSIEPIKIK